jgi:hypothetical protein
MAKNVALAWNVPQGMYSMQKPIFRSLMRFSLASPRLQYHHILVIPDVGWLPNLAFNCRIGYGLFS